MKRKLALMLSVAMVLGGLTACSSGGSDTKTTENAATEGTAGTDAASAESEEGTAAPVSTGEGKQLVVEIGPNPETLDPALNSAVDGGNMLLHNFECLLTIDQDEHIQPGQAETWETSEDGLTWTFYLRDGLKWSDGSDLTANDFVYSWKRVCDPNVAAPYADTVLSMVKGFDEAVAGDIDVLAVSAPDDKTFVVELSSPCTFFDSLAAFATLSPVQQGTIETNGDSWAIDPETYVSNGAFHVTEWVPNSHIIMTKNENYWDKDSIKLESIKFLLMEDTNAAYSAYQTGEALMIKDVPIEEVPSLEGNPEFYIDPMIGTYYISFQTEKEPYNDANIRKALSLAIDRDYVANTLMQGTYSPAYNFIGPGWVDTDGTYFVDNANGGEPYIDITKHDENVEEAKRILEEAGYPNGEGLPTMTYSTNDASYHKPLAEYLQQAWGELGVTVEVEILEWASFTPTRRAGDYEIARDGWVGDYSDPSNMLDCLYSTNGNNNANYNSPEFDAQMDIARSTVDPEERSAALHKAEDILMEDAAAVPVAFYNEFYLQSDKITGMWYSPRGYWYFLYADIAE